MKGFKNSFKSRSFKMGGYQTLIMVIVIAIVVAVNFVVAKMNIAVDLSSDQKYTLTEDSKNLARSIKDDIKLYYMCQEENKAMVIEKVVEQYDGLGNVKVVDKDPVIYPNFAKQYTDSEIQENDIIVVNETNGKSRHVSLSDMYTTDMDYATYSQTNTLDAEGQITSALQTVTSTESKKLYYTSGHSEAELGTGFTDILNKSNIEPAEFATADAESVPGDCSILMVNAPKYDFSEKEYNIISEYLQNGGKALFYLNALPEDSQQNYYKLLSDYGINVEKGYVLDSETMSGNATVLTPELQSHDITEGVEENLYAVAPICLGMTVQSDVRPTLTVEPFMISSDSSFARSNKESESLEKQKDDVAGPFSIGLLATDDYTEKTEGEGKAAKLVVFSCGSFNYSAELGRDLVSNNQFANRTIVLNSLTALAGGQTTTLAIPERSLDMDMVMIQEGDRIFFTVVLVVLLPLLLLGCGFAIWLKRRKN